MIHAATAIAPQVVAQMTMAEAGVLAPRTHSCHDHREGHQLARPGAFFVLRRIPLQPPRGVPRWSSPMTSQLLPTSAVRQFAAGPGVVVDRGSG